MGTIKGMNTVEDLRAWLPGATILDTTAKQNHRPVGADRPLSDDFVAPHVEVVNGKLTAWIPAVTRSEANERAWQRIMSRKLSAKSAVRKTLGLCLSEFVKFSEHYHMGGSLKVAFTRLGGRRLDACNLPSSMKSIEDMIAGLLLADDGDSRWQVGYDQEPGGLVGVRVAIELVGIARCD